MSELQVKYKRESFDECIDAINMLVDSHHDEVGPSKSEELDPDYGTYKALDEQGKLAIFTARTEDGELGGYCVFYIVPHSYYNALVAQSDLIYVRPEFRGRGVVKGMIDFAEQELDPAVDGFIIQVNAEQDFGGSLEGYAKASIMYCKYRR